MRDAAFASPQLRNVARNVVDVSCRRWTSAFVTALSAEQLPS